EQLAMEGAKASLSNLVDQLEISAWDGFDKQRAQELLTNAAQNAGVKKGVIMKSLRAALLGRLQGPDLITTWGLLARIREDLNRLRRCL
ncbi:MAG: glutamate--tRNA ligase, partial [Prochlorococcus sp.]